MCPMAVGRGTNQILLSEVGWRKMTKCLVIEDSEMVRRTMVRVLESLDLCVLEADGPASAIEAYYRDNPDIVFIDWDLPGLGALDFLKEVVSSKADKRPPMVLCAAENDPRQIALAKAAGVEFHVLKPFDTASIKDVLRKADVGRIMAEQLLAKAS